MTGLPTPTTTTHPHPYPTHTPSTRWSCWRTPASSSPRSRPCRRSASPRGTASRWWAICTGSSRTSSPSSPSTGSPPRFVGSFVCVGWVIGWLFGSNLKIPHQTTNKTNNTRPHPTPSFCFFKKESEYLFNGDLVDRGAYGAEVLFTILAFKCLLPRQVRVNRGNHECRQQVRRLAFWGVYGLGGGWGLRWCWCMKDTALIHSHRPPPNRTG